MRPHKPSTGGSINGLNALEFDGVASTSHEKMDAKKNGSTNWNPAGADGAASGTYNDVVLTLLMRANGNGKVRITVLSIWDGLNIGMGGVTNGFILVILVVMINESTLILGACLIF